MDGQMSMFPVTDAEWRERSKRLGSLVQEYKRIEENKKEMQKEMAKQLKELRDEIDKLGDVVVYGKEMRPLDFGETPDWDR